MQTKEKTRKEIEEEYEAAALHWSKQAWLKGKYENKPFDVKRRNSPETEQASQNRSAPKIETKNYSKHSPETVLASYGYMSKETQKYFESTDIKTDSNGSKYVEASSKSGTKIKDYGEKLSTKGTKKEDDIKAMVALAAERGWESLDLSGNSYLIDVAKKEAEKYGMTVNIKKKEKSAENQTPAKASEKTSATQPSAANQNGDVPKEVGKFFESEAKTNPGGPKKVKFYSRPAVKACLKVAAKAAPKMAASGVAIYLGVGLPYGVAMMGYNAYKEMKAYDQKQAEQEKMAANVSKFMTKGKVKTHEKKPLFGRYQPWVKMAAKVAVIGGAMATGSAAAGLVVAGGMAAYSMLKAAGYLEKKKLGEKVPTKEEKVKRTIKSVATSSAYIAMAVGMAALRQKYGVDLSGITSAIPGLDLAGGELGTGAVDVDTTTIDPSGITSGELGNIDPTGIDTTINNPVGHEAGHINPTIDNGNLDVGEATRGLTVDGQGTENLTGRTHIEPITELEPRLVTKIDVPETKIEPLELQDTDIDHTAVDNGNAAGNEGGGGFFKKLFGGSGKHSDVTHDADQGNLGGHHTDATHETGHSNMTKTVTVDNDGGTHTHIEGEGEYTDYEYDKHSKTTVDDGVTKKVEVKTFSGSPSDLREADPELYEKLYGNRNLRGVHHSTTNASSNIDATGDATHTVDQQPVVENETGGQNGGGGKKGAEVHDMVADGHHSATRTVEMHGGFVDVAKSTPEFLKKVIFGRPDGR